MEPPADVHQVHLVHGVAACDAGLPLQQVVEDESAEVALLRGEALQVQVDLELDMLAH